MPANGVDEGAVAHEPVLVDMAAKVHELVADDLVGLDTVEVISQPRINAGGTDMRMNTISAYGGKKVTRQSSWPAKRISRSVKN